MANVPLKSLTFPGLSDTYTVPQIDNTLTTSGKAADAKKTGDELNDLKSAINSVVNKSDNLVDPTKRSAGYLVNGSVVSDNSYSTTDYIAIESGTYVKKILSPGMLGSGANKLTTYNSSKTYISTIDGELLETGWYKYTFSSNVSYIRFSSGTNTLEGVYFGSGNAVVNPVPDYGYMANPDFRINYTQVDNSPDIPSQTQIDKNTKNISRIAEISSNMVNPTKRIAGYLVSGNVISNDGYSTSDFISVVPGTYVKKVLSPANLGTGAKSIAIYNSSKTYISTIDGELLETGWYKYTITENAKYIRLSSGTNTLEGVYFGEGENIVDQVPIYGFIINEDGKIDYSQILNAPEQGQYEYRSALTGKVWYAVGDSSTHGDFNSITQPPIQSGMYAGELPVYPFLIGNRTGMIVHNIAVNGAVMATITNQPDRYQWSADNHYQLVGADADFITIWIGANDMWQSVPIGTIDSNDATTFYGAFNLVLNWYINNRPYAKIGLVASYWCTEQYCTAVKNLGAKYGIPVLNFYDDPNVPVSVGSMRPDVSSSVKTLRNSQYVVSETNSHGNAQFHELESYFIEEWLKTL